MTGQFQRARSLLSDTAPDTVTTGCDTEPVNRDFHLQEPLRSKGLLWARALRRQTIGYWYATTVKIIIDLS